MPTENKKAPAYDQKRAMQRNRRTVAQARVTPKWSQKSPNFMRLSQARGVNAPIWANKGYMPTEMARTARTVAQAEDIIRQPGYAGRVIDSQRAGIPAVKAPIQTSLMPLNTMGPMPVKPNAQTVFKGGGNAPSAHGTWGYEMWPEGYTTSPAAAVSEQPAPAYYGGGWGGGWGGGGYSYPSYGSDYARYTGPSDQYSRAYGYAPGVENNPYWRRALATWRF